MIHKLSSLHVSMPSYITNPTKYAITNVLRDIIFNRIIILSASLYCGKWKLHPMLIFSKIFSYTN